MSRAGAEFILNTLKVMRVLCGIALLPVCVGATAALLESVHAVNGPDTFSAPESVALFGGYITWLTLWFVLPRPARSYVLAHELTHALCALLFGAEVRDIRVSERGGSVSLSKSNLWITLAPYFLPLYTFMVIALYLAVSLFQQPVPWKPLWFFLVGFTWSYHACFTLNSLLMRQPDIQVYGRIFSYAVIYCLNLLMVALWLVATTPAETRTLAASFLAHTRSTYALIAEGSAALLRKAAGRLR
jgi:hypothetical protein